MELFFPLLGMALAYLASWVAGLYLLAQYVFLGQGRRKDAWFVLWVCVWPAFASGLAVTLVSLPPVWVLCRVGVFAPYLWLICLYRFRKARAGRKTQKSRPVNLPPDETVWPPPPKL